MMTLSDLLTKLRGQLLDAVNGDDRTKAEDLFITLATLRDSSYAFKSENLTSLIVDMTDAARDAAMGVKGKAEIPTEDAIRALFSPNTRAS